MATYDLVAIGRITGTPGDERLASLITKEVTEKKQEREAIKPHPP
jgi:hypothetical protein